MVLYSSESLSVPVPQISLLDLLSAVPLETLIGKEAAIAILIPDSYLSEIQLTDSASEALAMQRLLTVVHLCSTVTIVWEPAAARRVLASPSVHPLAGLTLCLNGVEHKLPIDNLRDKRLTLEKARSTVLKHRLQADMFADSQMIVCVDHRGFPPPLDLYGKDSGQLLGEDQFESFVDDLLSQHSLGRLDGPAMAKRRLPTAVIIRELIQNSDDHGKTNVDGEPLKPNSLRGLVIKRVMQKRIMPTKEALKDSAPLACLELSVFDSGIGYYDSYRRQLTRGQARGNAVIVGESQVDILRQYPLGPDVPMEVERAILLKCLGRHSDSSIPDPRPGHRGMGLYEVLRATQFMGGLFEVRTGRFHGYRSFLKGDWQTQLEPHTSMTRPGKPKPSLLDFTQPMLTRPTLQEQLIGTVVRVVIPLS